MAKTAQIRKGNDGLSFLLRHEGQSIWKMSRTLKVSSSEVAKTIKRYDETGSHESKFEIYGSNNRVFVRCRVGERIISAYVVPTMKHGGGGVMEWGGFSGDTVSDLFRIQGTLNQHSYHSILP